MFHSIVRYLFGVAKQVAYGFLGGSHIRLTRISEKSEHHISIPNHDPLKLGTLSSVLIDVAEHLKITREELLDKL